MTPPNPFQPDTLPGRSHDGHPSRSVNHQVESWPDSGAPVVLDINSRWSSGVLFGAMVLTFGFLLVRVIQLQVVRGSDFRSRAEGNRIRTVITPAPRGAIVDRHGAVLAENIPNFTVTVTPADLPSDAAQRDAMIDRLAGIIGLSVADINTTLRSSSRRPTDPVTVMEQVPYAAAMNNIVATADMPAVNIVGVPNRYYPHAEATATSLGYTGRVSPEELQRQSAINPLDIVGKTGLERSYNDVLTGQDGVRQVERDVYNREQRGLSKREPQPGQTVVTTLDLDLQRLLAEQLQAAVTSQRSPGGAAVALDPNNGDVLAMVSAPSYDDNLFVTAGHSAAITKILNDPRTPLINRVISGQYPSGSIIKPFIAAAALTERVVTPSTTVLSVGGFTVGYDFFPDWKAGGHGLVNITTALAESVNTFFYAVGGGYQNIIGLGVDRIVEYLQRFGWGRTLGIDLPSEASGLLPTKDWRTTKRPSPWKLGDTYHLSIGQGDLEVTPLQVAAAVGAVANGGTLYQPRLVQAIRNPDGTTARNIAPRSLTDQVVPASVLTTVRAGMRAGVISGSSRAMQSLPVTSAAKTGTAQFGGEGKTHAWFAAFAPFDRPQIVVVVLVEGGGEGYAAALPIARDALQWYFSAGPGKTST
ncbi:MAG: penicillin-binding protein 2 [Patescibacteria group bacterium]